MAASIEQLEARIATLERQAMRDHRKIELLRRRQRLELETFTTMGGVAKSILERQAEIRKELEEIDREEAEDNQGVADA